MIKYVCLFLAIVICSCNSKPKIYGCIDKNALNYDSIATLMKDSSCIVLNINKITHDKKKTKVVIDTLKYSNYEYKFIYPAINIDTLVEIKKYLIQNRGFSYYRYSVFESDTVIMSSNSFLNNDRDLYVSDNVKVIEDIEGFRSKIYYIDVNDGETNIINPRQRFSYRTETVVYERFPSFDGPPNTVNRYTGFYINIPRRIDYWFDSHPSTITVYDNEYSLQKYYRTNITRY